MSLSLDGQQKTFQEALNTRDYCAQLLTRRTSQHEKAYSGSIIFKCYFSLSIVGKKKTAPLHLTNLAYVFLLRLDD